MLKNEQECSRYKSGLARRSGGYMNKIEDRRIADGKGSHGDVVNKAITGFAGGALLGSFGGMPGAVAGAVIGTVANVAADLIASNRRAAEDRKTDKPSGHDS